MTRIKASFLTALVTALGLGAHAAVPAPERAAASRGGPQPLRAAHAALAPKLARNAFGRPIHLDSQELDSALKGEVYAVVNHPFEQVRDALQNASSWCEVMLLPFNTKACAADADAIHVYIGRKKDTPIGSAYRVDFHYSVLSRTEEYLNVALDAPSGPMGTHDYRIALEAAPLENGRAFIHLSYSYGFGAMSRLAMSTYLATAGAEKVGFSTDGSGSLVHGVRGVIERNTMRYFLAIDAYLDSLASPAEMRVEKRLREWFSATERYPQQLHEMELDEYLAMKRREYARLAAR